MNFERRENETPLGQSGAVQNGGEAAGRLYCNTRGKPVASLVGRTLTKNVRASVHMLRQPRGWAFDLDILRQARADGAVAAEVRDLETGLTYWATLSAFDRWGVRFNRGFGEQICLPLDRWQVEKADSRQLALFGEVQP